MMTIEKVSNGYIVRTAHRTEVYTDLVKVFETALLHFEGKGKYFGGDSFGRVVIETSGQEVDPA